MAGRQSGRRNGQVQSNGEASTSSKRWVKISWNGFALAICLMFVAFRSAYFDWSFTKASVQFMTRDPAIEGAKTGSSNRSGEIVDTATSISLERERFSRRETELSAEKPESAGENLLANSQNVSSATTSGILERKVVESEAISLTELRENEGQQSGKSENTTETKAVETKEAKSLEKDGGKSVETQNATENIIANEIFLQQPSNETQENQAAADNANETASSRFKLRFDWTRLEPLSPLAILIDNHQKNCALPLADFEYPNIAGLGADIHVWGQALCNGMEQGLRIRTVGSWIYADEAKCNRTNQRPSVMTCYFPQSELQCPGDFEIANAHPTYNLSLSSVPQNVSDARPAYQYDGKLRVLSTRWGSLRGRVGRWCHSYQKRFPRSSLRAAFTEFLFCRVSPLVQQEAERQLALVFKEAGEVPKDLITLHVRWGDKVRFEMKRVNITQYVNAVYNILEKRGNRSASANIFMATEDPKALDAFKSEAPKNWKIYLDQYYVEYLPYRVDKNSYFAGVSRNLKGTIGLIAVGSLLVALEANDYVLTTASNWSRMINELRKNILNPRCNDCTQLIDLQGGGEW